MQVKLSIKKTGFTREMPGRLVKTAGIRWRERWVEDGTEDREEEIETKMKSQGENLDIYFKQCCNKTFSEFINTIIQIASGLQKMTTVLHVNMKVTF